MEPQLACYWRNLASGRRVGFRMDVFNLFDLSRVTDYNQNTEISFRVLNPDFGAVSGYQRPRQVRLGLRFEF